MSLPIRPGQRRAIQWFIVLIGILVVAVFGVPRAVPSAAIAQAPAADGDPYPWLAPCSKLSAHRLLETAVPATAAPPTAAPANPAPTATPRPAPQEDRVGFPSLYRESFRLLVVFDRPDNKQVRALCANEKAAGISPGKDFPYGSVLVMETWRAKQDSSGQPVRDANGHYIRQTLTGVFVMRKEKGFGTAYGPDRSGEWEYTAYRPDGSTLTAPSHTNPCASCHLRQAGDSTDYVFRMQMYFDWPEALAPHDLGDNTINTFVYSFFPAKRTIKAGTTITWVNNDEAEHTVVSSEGSYKSENLKTRNIKPGDSFSVTFVTPGTFPYFCSIHPAMKGVIEVTQ
ncbi:MAG TPA: cytochrome P460 family protein [Roseiflexaceae bacterium]|jgi:plastocyanin